MKIELTTNATATNPFTVVGTLPTGITSSYSLVGSKGTFTLTGTASLADYQFVLSQLQFTGNQAATTTYTINVSVTSAVDATTSNTATANVTISKVTPLIDLDGVNGKRDGGEYRL